MPNENSITDLWKQNHISIADLRTKKIFVEYEQEKTEAFAAKLKF
jgi:hypothetical protein